MGREPAYAEGAREALAGRAAAVAASSSGAAAAASTEPVSAEPSAATPVSAEPFAAAPISAAPFPAAHFSTAPSAQAGEGALPAWLGQTQDFQPGRDRDGYVQRSLLSLGGVLAQLRLDDGRSGRFSPSAPVKLLLGLGCILLTSLSRNYAFVVLMLALVLVRMALLSAPALRRAVGVSAGAAAFSFVLMLPAVLIGQPHAAVLIASKVLVSVGTAMCIALSTPYSQLSQGLRALHVPALVVMTIDLAMRGIVVLGRTALEMLTALRLRSVGRNRDKATSIGGVGGSLLLKSSRASQDTYEAMNCRGFDGQYSRGATRGLKAIDAAWIAGFALLVAAFVYLQGLV